MGDRERLPLLPALASRTSGNSNIGGNDGRGRAAAGRHDTGLHWPTWREARAARASAPVCNRQDRACDVGIGARRSTTSTSSIRTEDYNMTKDTHAYPTEIAISPRTRQRSNSDRTRRRGRCWHAPGPANGATAPLRPSGSPTPAAFWCRRLDLRPPRSIRCCRRKLWSKLRPHEHRSLQRGFRPLE